MHKMRLARSVRDRRTPKERQAQVRYIEAALAAAEAVAEAKPRTLRIPWLKSALAPSIARYQRGGGRV